MKPAKTIVLLGCLLGLLIPGLSAAQDCPGAIDVNCGDTVAGDSSGGPTNFTQYDCFNWELTGPEAYYRLTLATNSEVTAEVDPDGWDTAIIILPESGGECTTPPLACGDDGYDDANEIASTSLEAGVYYIVIEGWDGAAGAFDLTVSCCDDLDGDGFGSDTCGGADCCDTGDEGLAGCDAENAPKFHPGALDWCADGIDHDCDGQDCCPDLDGDGYGGVGCGGMDCCDEGTEDSPGCTPDAAADIFPLAEEVCGNAVDEDCDGHLDETCPTCAASDSLDCESNNSGSVDTSTGTNNVSDYCHFYPEEGMLCLGEYNGTDWSGPELIFDFTPAEDTAIVFTMTNPSDFLDVFVMTDYGSSDTCNPHNAIAWGGRSWGDPPPPVGFWASAGETYFVSIDGREGLDATCDWAITCNAGEMCVVDEAIDCAASVTGDTTDLDNDINVYGSGGSAAGPEYVYSFTPTLDSSVTATLSFDASLDLELYILEDDGSGDCLPGNTIAASATASAVESTSFTAAAGATYYIVVDGWTDTDFGAFSLDVTCDSCAEGETLCGGRDCVDTSTDVVHCGGCGMYCDLFGVDQHACEGGNCLVVTCDENFDDCNLTDADGCEADLMTDNNNCGSCDEVCSEPTPVCINGVCDSCPDGQTLCGATCVDLQTDENHCGACDSPCAAGETCCAGTCVDLLADEANCGDCGVTCAGGEECIDGLCCAAGMANCDGVCVDLDTDPANCGACGVVCDLDNVEAHGCAAGACTVADCAAGFGDCDEDAATGCEVDTTTSLDHCGQCANACDLANVDEQACEAGACTIVTCTDPWFDCDEDDATGCETEIGTVDDCGECGDACDAGQECQGGDCCTDADGDGHYDPTGCAAGDDCDDTDETAFPGNDEACDQVDNDCDGNIDEGFDADNDGFTSCGGDCDDNNNGIYPGAEEVCGDDIDQDCDGQDLDCECPDADGDGHQAETCGGDDCNDNDDDIYEGNAEICGDDKDNNCNGEVDEDCGGDDDGGCGCSAAGGSPLSSGLLVVLFVLGMLWLPRRRQ